MRAADSQATHGNSGYSSKQPRPGGPSAAAKAHTIRLTAPLQLHRVAVQQSAALTTADAGPAERKAYRVYATRIQTAEQ